MAVGSTTPKMSLLTIGRLSILPMPAAGVSRHRSTTVISEIPRRSRLGPLLSGAAECTPNANHMGRAGVSCQALPTARVPHLATLRVPLGGRGNDSEPLSGKRSKNAARRRPHWGRGIFWTGPLREAWLARVSCPGQQGARLLRGGGRSTEPRGSWPLSPPAARPPPLALVQTGDAGVRVRKGQPVFDRREACGARTSALWGPGVAGTLQEGQSTFWKWTTGGGAGGPGVPSNRRIQTGRYRMPAHPSAAAGRRTYIFPVCLAGPTTRVALEYCTPRCGYLGHPVVRVPRVCTWLRAADRCWSRVSARWGGEGGGIE